jgi:SAM-dependent methyltransferase
MSLRALYRRTIPRSARRALRSFARELPIRLRDGAADLRDAVRPPALPLPPARLRASVGINSARTHFLTIGERAAADILNMLTTHGFAARGRWLDFGCGSGRVARHFAANPDISLAGVDVDARAVTWAARHLPGDYRVTAPEPPLPFHDGFFDVVYAVSVFTHFDEASQFRWLAELRRVLRAGGALVASTHAPLLVYNRPDLTRAHHEALNANGFTFIAGTIGFNDDSAFHHADYMRREWTRGFEPVAHVTHGLNGYQDLSLWRAA